ncbi:MAG: hypothetical protein ACFCD0_23875 [Gemmataceae bacterium]
MGIFDAGSPFHGEFSSTDASSLSEANARFTLYKAGKAGNDSFTLSSDQQVVITDIQIMASVALTLTLFDGADSVSTSGEIVAQGDFGAGGGLTISLQTPHFCQKGTYPKVATDAAGQIDAFIHGVILNDIN